MNINYLQDKPLHRRSRPDGFSRHALGTPSAVALVGALVVLPALAGTASAAPMAAGHPAPPACTIRWVGPSTGGLWATTANWDPGRVPGAGDVVCISKVSGTVTYDGSGSSPNTTVAQLSSSAALAVTGGSLVISDTASTTNVVKGLSVAGGDLGSTSAPEASLVVDGPFSWTSGSLYAPQPGTSDEYQPALTVVKGQSATLDAPDNNGAGVYSWDLVFNGPLSVLRTPTIYDYGTITSSSTVDLEASICAGNYCGVPGPGGSNIYGGAGVGFTLTATGTLTNNGNNVINTYVTLLGTVVVPASTNLVIGGCNDYDTTGTQCSGLLDGDFEVDGSVTLNATGIGPSETSSGTGAVQLNGPLNVQGPLDVGSVDVTTQCEAICYPDGTVISAPLNLSGTLSINAEVNLLTSAAGSVVDGFTLDGDLGSGDDNTMDQASLIDKGQFWWGSGWFDAPPTQSPAPVLTVASGSTATITDDADHASKWHLDIASPLSGPQGNGGYAPAFGLDDGAVLGLAGTATFGDNTDITSNDNSGEIVVTKTGTLTKTATGGKATFDVPVESAGTVAASDGVLALSSLTNTGTLDLSTGTVTIASAYSPAAGSEMAETIAGTTAGTTYGQLDVGGEATLNGTLAISTAAGFAPTAGEAGPGHGGVDPAEQQRCRHWALL